MTLSGRGRRQKGHQFERDIANLLKKYFPDAKRGYQSRNQIDLVPDVEIPHFFVECKRGKQTNIKAALRQALEKRSKGDDRIALAVCKDDRQDATVTLRLQDFLKLLDRLFLDESLDNDS